MSKGDGMRLIAGLLLLWGGACSANEKDSASRVHEPSCQVGSYRMADGSALDIGPDEPGQLRWRTTDGRTGALKPIGNDQWSSSYGWTGVTESRSVRISDCRKGQIEMDKMVGRRESLTELETRFRSNDVELAGRLTMPPGSAQVPLVVLVHGAEHDSALLNYPLQRQFASAGIGVFAYDKRGTGSSAGRYTQNYLLLAVDAVHAAREARRLAGARAGRIGYQGGSQGGWVAPLAAQIEPVDFVIVSFGLAVSPLEEDREAITLDLARAGFGAHGLEGALELAEAAATIVESDFREGFEKFDSLRAKYRSEAWFSSVRGNYTGFMLSASTEVLRQQGPSMLAGIPLRYDPMPVLKNLDTPQLWLLGGEDRDAPPGETMRRLASLKEGGKPIDVFVFPGADHGLYEFKTKKDGERVFTRQPATYFQRMRDFILGN
ncbi:MAG: alpha/beta fold hydrolase [Alphaproteobacteria bacterium]|nr:MAG: alpha/beta fold hydrolase [Alphaproteobacteria bacterium]